MEAGLAGLVNVRSRRPFDFDGFEIAGSVWGLYTYQADKITPNGNILVTNRWDVGDGGEIVLGERVQFGAQVALHLGREGLPRRAHALLAVHQAQARAGGR